MEKNDEIGALMDKLLYEAAINGDKNFLLNYDNTHENYFSRTTYNKNNIIHISVQHEEFDFAKEAAKRWPELINRSNIDGNNPLHIAAEIGNVGVIEVFVEKSKDNKHILSWRGKNKQGNTPLHVALIHGNFKVACYLVDLDPSLACSSNELMETPLHLAVRYRSTGLDREEDSLSIVELLLQKERSVACWHDSKGLTPLHTTVMVNPPYFEAIQVILNHCSESAEKRDIYGSTILHLISRLPDESGASEFLRFPSIRVLKNKQDDVGNTPAHIAVTNENSDMIISLHNILANVRLKNKQDISSEDLIGQQSQDFQNTLIEKVKFPWKYRRKFEDFPPRFSETEEEAIREMDWKSLRKGIKEIGSSFFRKTTSNYENILHLRFNIRSEMIEQLEFEELLDSALENFPLIICQVDMMEYSPLHVMVLNAPSMVSIQVLKMVTDCYDRIVRESYIHELSYDPPLKGKDRHGNTPLHLALVSTGRNSQNPPFEYIRCGREIAFFDSKLLMEQNSHGETPLHLLSTASKFALEHETTTDEMKREILENVEFIIDQSHPVAFEKCDYNGLTPLHRAAQNKDLSTLLLMQQRVGTTETEGNTPWHLLAEMKFDEGHEQLLDSFSEYLDSIAFGLMKLNEDGNSPLHLAMMNHNIKFVQFAFDRMRYITQYDMEKNANNDGDTLLHLAVGKCRSPDVQNFIRKVYHSLEDVIKPNKEGNTPLHLAILEDDLDFADIIFHMFGSTDVQLRRILEKGDKDQNTPLHLAILKGKSEFANMFFNRGEAIGCIQEILLKPNSEGNTPFHLTITKREFELARKFIEYATKNSCIDKILDICNNKDETPGGLLGSHTELPDDFEKFLWKKPEVVQAMLGVRSLSGISTKMISEYTSTIGVIAALFATITFTAAFTVPGGLNSNNGTPLLMKDPAFQVFMVFDILAMCLSMMVLFCLLWIMTIGNKKHQVLLLDLTIYLLEGSFYATILTFMTGLYATVFPVTSWIAILACVLCTLLILLMHKRFIIGIIPCFIRIYVSFQRAYSPVRDVTERILCFPRKDHEKNEEVVRAPDEQGQTIVDVQALN